MRFTPSITKTVDRRTAVTRGVGPIAALALCLVLAGCAVDAPRGPVAEPAPQARPGAPSSVPRLSGSSWYWIGTATPAGLFAPRDPGAFNLEFLDGGQLAVQLDCNTGSASWQQSGRSLSLGALRATRKACPTLSESDRFSRQLALVRGAQTAGPFLELLLGDAGTLMLARDPDWRLRQFDCVGGGAFLAAFGRDEAVVRWSGRFWNLKRQPSASGARYGAGTMILFNRGDEASLLNEGKQVAGPCSSRR